jgi:integrase
MAYAQRHGKGWRCRYKKPDGTWGSQSGFETKAAAQEWGNEQELLIRRQLWIDPGEAETPFGTFAEAWLANARLAVTTQAKYCSYLGNHLLPQWEDWPLILIFNNHLEIQGWVSELHDELAEPTVASVFALFSTIMNVAVRARKIPASPCHGIRVTSGQYEAEHQVATPVQFLRAALRLHRSFGLRRVCAGLDGDGYTGARWSELVGLEPFEYDEINKAIRVHEPLAETRGHFVKAKRPKTPASKRWVQLPPFLAGLYETLLDDCARPYVFVGENGGNLRRSNFGRRFWRPAWDGDPDNPDPARRAAQIVPGFTFHEGRHTQRTWLADDGIPEVARAARLGRKMPGMASVYEHVTRQMQQRVLGALQARWESSLLTLRSKERGELITLQPQLQQAINELEARQQAPSGENRKIIAQISPKQA